MNKALFVTLALGAAVAFAGSATLTDRSHGNFRPTPSEPQPKLWLTKHVSSDQV